MDSVKVDPDGSVRVNSCSCCSFTYYTRAEAEAMFGPEYLEESPEKELTPAIAAEIRASLLATIAALDRIIPASKQSDFYLDEQARADLVEVIQTHLNERLDASYVEADLHERLEGLLFLFEDGN